jgi:hypothetical protein
MIWFAAYGGFAATLYSDGVVAFRVESGKPLERVRVLRCRATFVDAVLVVEPPVSVPCEVVEELVRRLRIDLRIHSVHVEAAAYLANHGKP